DVCVALRVLADRRRGDGPPVRRGEPAYDEKTDQPVIPKTVTIDMHRLPTFDDAVAAAVALAGTDSWARYATARQVDTSRLRRVGRFEGKVLSADAGMFVRLPFEPGAGFYVLTIGQAGAPVPLPARGKKGA